MVDKIKNLFLLILCFLYAPFRGKATKKIGSPRKILILQMAKLGDMVCTTPMFRAVKEKYPDAKVYVVGNSVNKELLEGNKDVDEYFVSDKSNFWKLVRRLRREKVDFSCQTSPGFEYLAMLYLAGTPLIATPKIVNGWSPWETRAYKILRKLVLPVSHKMGSYAPREYLRLLEPIKIFTEKTTKYLSFSNKAEETVKNLFLMDGVSDSDFLICISPAAGNKIKQWSPKKFAEVADYLYKNYQAKIFVIGAKNDDVEVQEMFHHLNSDTKIMSTLGKLNLDELKALISRMDMFISVDTGPIYVAETFNVPTVDITGPIDEKEQPPIGKLNRIVHIKNREKPELYVMNAKMYNEVEARRQTNEITTRMVVDEIDDLYSYIKND